MSLYQEVRPRDFSEIIGNAAVVKSMEKMMGVAERPHAILITGPSGCGKTTLGRIFARKVGSSESSTIELNAANTRGIDTVREVNESARLSSIDGAAKTYIIDESHELTNAAQEAFLKILEDHPPDCYFIFCTTAPEKIIATIQNRCAKFNVCRLSEGEILQLLNRTCTQKSFKTSSEIQQAIACLCEGSPRAALVALEAVQGIDDFEEALQLIVKGTEKDVNIFELCQILYAAPQVRRQKWQLALKICNLLEGDLEQIRRAIMSYLFKRLLSCQKEEDAVDIVKVMSIFSYSLYYGNKAHLGLMIARACFGDLNI